jgi:hypothetical protein
MSKFIFITSKSGENSQSSLLSVLRNLHLVNSVLIYESKKEQIKIVISNMFDKDQRLILNDQKEIQNLTEHQSLAEVLFPDKFTNLSNFELEIYMMSYWPLTYVDDNKFYCEKCFFIDILQQYLGVKIRYVEMAKQYKDFFQKLSMTLTTLFFNHMYFTVYIHIDRYTFTSDVFPKLTLYDHYEYCFVVRLPPKIPIFEQILFLPFDVWVWILFFITIGCCAVVWQLYRKHGALDSTWKFLFALYGHFFIQRTVLRM